MLPILANPLALPTALALDKSGTAYVGNASAGTVVSIAADGTARQLASGLTLPIALAVDGGGNVYAVNGPGYITSPQPNTVVKIAPDGTVTTIAGAAQNIGLPVALALDSAGNLYVGQQYEFSGTILKVTPDGTVSSFSGDGSAFEPQWLAVDASGNVYAAVSGGINQQPPAIVKISPDGTVNSFVQGNYGPLALDAAGNLYVEPLVQNGPPYQIIRYAPDGTPSPLSTLALADPFTAMAFDPAGNLLAADGAGNQILEIQLNPSPLASAVLPEARSVQAGNPATIFATILNGGSAALDNCRIALPGTAPSGLTLQYQTTAAATNALTGTVNTPATIAAQGAQSFVVGFTASDPLTASGLAPVFLCDGADPAPVTIGVNTVDLLFAAVPVADIIVASATASGNGIVTVPFSKSQSAAFALATYDNGAASALTAVSDTGAATLPITVTLCQTVPATGACMAPPAATVPVSFTNGSTPTFSAFVSASAAVPFAPGTARIFVRFLDGDGVSHGATSVAVETD